VQYDLPLDNGVHRACLLNTATITDDLEKTDILVFILYLVGIVGFLFVGFLFPPFIIMSGILTIFFSFFVKNVLQEPTLFVVVLIFGALEMLMGVLFTFTSSG